jgi:catechol 2,3-dioxygenase-like lactoylglutathione lyase family enzyme
MRLDHIAYRVKDKKIALKFFKKCLGYEIDPSLKEGFDIQFEDGTIANCSVLVPPESASTNTGRVAYGMLGSEFHAAPEIFVSEGSDNSIVAEWVMTNGPGIHHIAYEVDSVEGSMSQWIKNGIEFMSETPLKCPGLVQIFTKPHPITGMIYELIERETLGFCKDNVKDLMNSTKEIK